MNGDAPANGPEPTGGEGPAEVPAPTGGEVPAPTGADAPANHALPPDITTNRRIPDLPDPNLYPPTVAEAGDPFAALRVVHLLARVSRGRAIPVRDVVARLNAEFLDWTFSPRVVADAVLQLQSNWMADYRTVDGIRLEEGPDGPAIEIEDTSRVDPWIVAQVDRLAAECRQQLREFARGEGHATEG